MKSIPMFLFFILLICSNVHGRIAIEQTYNSKAHPGYCYSETKEVGAMENGEVKTQEGECVRVTCLEGGLIKYFGCGIIAVSPNCMLGREDLSKPYPDCCPGLKC